MPRYSIIVCTLLLTMLVSASTLAQAPAGTVAASPPAQQQTPQPQASASPPQSTPASPSGQELDRKVERLESQLGSLNTTVIIVGSVLGIFLALGTAGSIFSLWNFERRASETHKLAIGGETAAQARAAEVHQSFLEGSKTTLELVNSTLTLARDASERAANFLVEKAREALDSLDREAKTLLATVPRSDDRALVADQRRRSTLMSLAQKLSAFETNRLILPRDVKLTPPCMFIRGMEHHLKQQFDDALEYWEQVALDGSAENSLRSLAWYWIGYEHNNLGEFPIAVSSFEQALTYSEGSRSYELQRILIESRFFNKDQVNPEDLVPSLEMLLSTIEKDTPSADLEARRLKVCGTLGNILHIIGETHRQGGNLEETNRYYQKAAQYFSEGSERDKWARFGLAESLFRGGQVDAARALFEKSVLSDAQRESVDRVEPRTKVLARVTEMICYARLPQFKDRLNHMYSQVLESLGDVDERLTVYSQLQRRNISRDEFRKELAQLEAEAEAEATDG
jgi:tetratricopeptide (TPR) repeat protein